MKTANGIPHLPLQETTFISTESKAVLLRAASHIPAEKTSNHSLLLFRKHGQNTRPQNWELNPLLRLSYIYIPLISERHSL
jgi:hypothetical protein